MKHMKKIILSVACACLIGIGGTGLASATCASQANSNCASAYAAAYANDICGYTPSGGCTLYGVSAQCLATCATKDATCADSKCTDNGAACVGGSCASSGSTCLNGNSACTKSRCPNRRASARKSGAKPTSTLKPTSTATANPTNTATPIATATVKSTDKAMPASTKAAKPTATPHSGSANAAMAEQVLDIVNTERAANGLGALVMDANLSEAAQVRAEEITRSFSHTRPDGGSFATVTSGAYGENIAKGQRSAERVMAAWMSSSGHRANILNARYGSIGICAYEYDGIMYWVQLFGK